MGERCSLLDFSSLKREQFKIEEQQEYFPWSAASAHNASFSSQARRRWGPSPLAGVRSPEAAGHTHPLVPRSTKPPQRPPAPPTPTQMPPSPQLSAGCSVSSRCFEKSPSRATVRFLWQGVPTAVWRQEAVMLSPPSSRLRRPQGMGLTAQQLERRKGSLPVQRSASMDGVQSFIRNHCAGPGLGSVASWRKKTGN